MAIDILSDIDKAQNSEMLMKDLEKISNYVDQQTSKIIESGDYQLATRLYDMVASAYDKAAKMIETDTKFLDLKTFSKSFLTTASYWHNKTELAKTETIERLGNIGADLQNQGQYMESIEYFNKAITIDPNVSKFWLDKGNSFYSLQMFNDAITCYDNAINADQNNSFAFCNKGLALYSLRMYPAALTCFDQALDKDQKMEYAFLGKGHVCLELKMYDESKKAYEHALSLNAKSVVAMLGLSSVYHRDTFNHVEAAKYAEKALQIDPNNINAKANLAEFLLESDDYKKREDLADDVLKAEPDEYGYPMRLVQICSLYIRKETDKAIVAANDLLEYYKSIHNKQILNWDFHGLKHMIENTERVSNQVKEILLDFISLAETSDESKKINILADLPAKIRSKGLLRSIFYANEAPNIFKKNQQPNIMVRNTSTPDPIRPGWYTWEIFLTPSESLNKVKNVTYTLHKSFSPNHIIPVTDRENDFRLQNSGWGEFQVKVEINFDDGKKMTKYHWLELGPTPLDHDA